MENLLNQNGAPELARRTAFQMFGLKDDKARVRCAKCGQWFNEDDGQWMPAQGVCEACYMEFVGKYND